MIADAVIANARERIPLPDLIGRSVALKRASRGLLVGLCPWHTEKTGSFAVFSDHYHCFGCGAHGDAIGFVMRSENLDFIEAVEQLVQLPLVGQPATRTPERTSRRREVSNAWRKPWQAAKTIAGTLAQEYLRARGLQFDDPDGEILRFHPACARIKPGTEAELERLPAMLALLRDVVTGEPTGILRTFLASDGRDRLRGDGARKVTGRRDGSAVMLSGFDDVTAGLGISEGVESGISVLNSGWAPVWAMTSSGNIAKLPPLLGIESLTVFADADPAGQRATAECVACWRAVRCETETAAPSQQGADWADEVIP
jgi:hypothetical protein